MHSANVSQLGPATGADVVVSVAGRRLVPTPVFDTYWRFAAQRQAVYEARVAGAPGPWTDDPIIARHRFTNCFRAADRVSQYLIRKVVYTGDQRFDEVFLRTMLFKLFNRIETWELMVENFGVPTLATFDVDGFADLLSEHFEGGQRLYSAAYVMPPPKLGASRKHTNHLRLLSMMLEGRLPERLEQVSSMSEAFLRLKEWPAIGDFLAYQFLIDLNYSSGLEFSEMDFVVPGPGARDGIRKCFGRSAAGIEAEVIRYMCDTQQEHFARLGLRFGGLRGRPLQLIDCQNLFCEVDKYARVAHPDIQGISGRSRIKQSFAASPGHASPWFPPKWGINSDRPLRLVTA